MPDQNGRYDPRELAGLANGVPILGQPAKVQAWFITAMVQCNCEKGSTLLIAGVLGAGQQCPECKRSYMIRGVKSDGAAMHFDLKCIVAPPKMSDAAGERT